MKSSTAKKPGKTGQKHAPAKSSPAVITDPKRIQEVIDAFARTTDQIVTLEELKTRLLSGKQLVMKYGVDVTAPDIHIGHAVNLWMYRRLQELGHKMVFLIGDFTTGIGDPTGKNKLRPVIPPEEIARNAEAFIRQAMMVLLDDPKTIEIRRNSEWLGKLSAKDLLQLMSTVTVDKLLSRDMFRKRQEQGKEIYQHELVYPILQGYDSVELAADLTVIGSDQLFNEMMGRDLQDRLNQPPQIIITTKITPGIDGGEKQSKSLGNYIGLSHSPREKFGRVMSMPDRLVPEYFRVYTEVPLSRISELEKASDPMRFKIELGREIVARYHGRDAADKEVEWFRSTFQDRAMPSDAPTVSFGAPAGTVTDVLVKCFGAAKSKSEIRRLIDQRAVTVNGSAIERPDSMLTLPADIKVGKRNWFRVTP